MKVMSGNLNAKVACNNISQQTIDNESVDPESNDNDIRIVNFATSKYLIVKSTIFPYRKFTNIFWHHDGIAPDHVLVDTGVNQVYQYF